MCENELDDWVKIPVERQIPWADTKKLGDSATPFRNDYVLELLHGALLPVFHREFKPLGEHS